MKHITTAPKPKLDEEIIYLEDIPKNRIIVGTRDKDGIRLIGIIVYRVYQDNKGYVLTNGSSEYHGYYGYFRTKKELIDYGIKLGYVFTLLD